MQHLDEGTIHALLDGELTGADAQAVEEHAQSCAACAARLAEERILQSEADRMIAELDAEAAAPVAAPAWAGPDLNALPMAPLEPRTAGPPLVLVPEREERPRGSLRYLGWAAGILVAVGAGWFASQARSGSPSFSEAPIPEIEQPPATPAQTATSDSVSDEAALAEAPGDSVMPGVVSGFSAAALAKAPVDSVMPGVVSGVSAAERTETRAVATAPPPAEVTPPAAKPEAALAVEEGEEDLNQARADSIAAARAAAQVAARARQAANDQLARSAREEPTRDAAARDRVGAAAPAAAAPAPRVTRRASSLEQQAQISMRVGLDEARRLLGDKPLHVIDGMRPEFVGVVPGHLIQGADPNDYVVRVVYVDDARRVIYLDQQRLSATRRQTGMGMDSVPPDWVKGEVRLSLKGDLSREELGRLADRVR